MLDADFAGGGARVFSGDIVLEPADDIRTSDSQEHVSLEGVLGLRYVGML